MYGLKKKNRKIQKNWEIHTETKIFFVLPNWRYFLLFLHFMQKFKYMYFLFVKKGSTLQERKVQKYITI